jgi:hypothetical protein
MSLQIQTIEHRGNLERFGRRLGLEYSDFRRIHKIPDSIQTIT